MIKRAAIAALIVAACYSVVWVVTTVEHIRGLAVGLAEAVIAYECEKIGVYDFDECVRGGTQGAVNEFLGRDTDPAYRGE
jgi:hypothetical protein